MYALHPGSLPPVGALDKTRIEVTADDLVRLYKLRPWEWIVWDRSDGYDWFDFIHLYPSYYGRYTLRPDRTPEKDIPCETKTLTSRTTSSSTPKPTSLPPTRCARKKR